MFTKKIYTIYTFSPILSSCHIKTYQHPSSKICNSCLIFSNCSIISWYYNWKCWSCGCLRLRWPVAGLQQQSWKCLLNYITVWYKSGLRSKGWIYKVLLPPMTCWVWPQVRPTFFSPCSLHFEGICALFTGPCSERGSIQNWIKPHQTCQQHVSWQMISSLGPWSLIHNTRWKYHAWW